MQELSIGGLTFVVEYRDFEGDRGPAVRVFGEVDGQRRQLLRFDCFDTDPHYHYDLEGENRIFHLDRLTMGCPVEFSLPGCRLAGGGGGAVNTSPAFVPRWRIPAASR